MIKSLKNGFKWTTFSTVFISVSAILKLSVLARFLDQEDFGLMAIVTFFLGFMDLFMDLGLSSAILHKQSITKKQYASLYWLNIIFSVLVFSIICIATPLISYFYEEPQLNLLLPLTASSVILSGLGRQFKTVAQKNMRFKFMSIIEIIASLTGLIVAVALATLKFGVYALVFGVISQNFTSNILFFIDGIKSEGIKFHFKFEETKQFLKMGLYQAGGQVINYFNRDFDILIIGKVFGTEILGGYSLAKQLVRRPLQFLNPIIMRIGLSYFPKISNNSEKLSTDFYNLHILYGIINALIFGIFVYFNEQIITVFYGSSFLNISKFLILFSVLMYLRSLGSLVGISVIVSGKTFIEFYWNLALLIVIPIVVLIGSSISVEAILIFTIILQLILTFPAWRFFYNKTIKIKLKEYLIAVLVPLALFFGVYLFSGLLQFENTLIEGLISLGVLITLTILYVYIFQRKFMSFIIKFNDFKY
ncbi:MAG: colanic acid exporter [Bacteroidetes bacterium]|jgi:O-antigen/teichoic acid export membrane protein|nr:MAG: colanic acid exporter [Bacteroidota bacterium]